MALDISSLGNGVDDTQKWSDFFDHYISEINEDFHILEGERLIQAGDSPIQESQLPSFSTKISDDLKMRLIDAFNGRYEPEEKPLFFKDDTWYIYGDIFTLEELRDIVAAYSGENDVDFLFLLNRKRNPSISKVQKGVQSRVHDIGVPHNFKVDHFENVVLWIMADNARLSQLKIDFPALQKKLGRQRNLFPGDDSLLKNYPQPHLYSECEKDDFGGVIIRTIKEGKQIDVAYYNNNEVKQILSFRVLHNTRLGER